MSLCCAAENLIQAALAKGLMGTVTVDAGAGSSLRIALEATRAMASPLFQAIPERQSTRAEYDGKPLTGEELRLLEKAGSESGVRVILLTEQAAMESVLDYIVQGNTAQMADAAFVKELKAWIRFNGADAAVRSGDGLYAASSGNPSLPAWLGKPLFDAFFTTGSENDKYAKHVRSSAGIAVFVADDASPAGWIDVRRCYERFALQPVEVPAERPRFARFLGLGERRPDLVIRFGRGPRLPPSLRRPVEAVLV